MLLAGRRTHNNRAPFLGFEGVIMGLIMGSQNIMGSDYGSNISGIDGNTRFPLTAAQQARIVTIDFGGLLQAHT